MMTIILCVGGLLALVGVASLAWSRRWVSRDPARMARRVAAELHELGLDEVAHRAH